MELFYQRSCAKTGPEAVESVTAALKNQNFSVLWDLDINQKFVEKGIEPEPFFHILEVCSAPRAKEALEHNQHVGYFLPCKMLVYKDRESQEIFVGLAHPSVFMNLLDDPGLKTLGEEVTIALTTAVDEACK